MMDMRVKGFYGQLKISGIAEPITEEGSVIEILRKFTTELSLRQVQKVKTGKRITMVFSDSPIKDGEQTASSESQLEFDLSDTVPRETESYEQFYQRLISDNVMPATAKFYADDWFDNPQDPELLSWMNDSTAQRFCELNFSSKAFESALPTEYETLKQYVQGKYPERTQGIKFRTA